VVRGVLSDRGLVRPEWDNWRDKTYYWGLGLWFKDYPLYSQEEADDPLVICKLFDPCGSASWHLTEYDPVKRIAFGFVKGLAENELGYISLTELESIKGPMGIGIEQDIYFMQKRLSQAKEKCL
jgi:hypothetical protein